MLSMLSRIVPRWNSHSQISYVQIRTDIMGMSKRKSVGKETSGGAQRILQLLDAEFEKWMDSVERAGLKLKAS